MKVIFNPGADSDLQEVRVPVGAVQVLVKRGQAKELPDKIAASLMKNRPAWWSKAPAEATQAVPAKAPEAAPKAKP